MDDWVRALNGRPRMRIGRGARAVEALLLQDIRALSRAARDQVRLLGRPVRVIVPSRSLRDHLAATLVDHLRRSVAGLSLQTLYGVAVEILERAGEQQTVSIPLFQVLVRRFAQQEGVLREALEHLVDGYTAVAATVSDLIDAGFEAVHAEAVDECLGAMTTVQVNTAALQRARALVRVAARTVEAMSDLGVGLNANLLRRAEELLDQSQADALPSRAILVYGFADATGVAADLLASLLRQCGGAIYLDHPPDPTSPDQSDLGVAFTQRFANHFADLADADTSPIASSPRPSLSLLKAPGAQAEVRAIALRISSLLDQGVRPERIGVVARDLTPYGIPLRLHFRRLGIPFSGIGHPGPPKPAKRWAQALLEVLRLRMSVPFDRWLEVAGGIFQVGATESKINDSTTSSDETTLFDLGLALRALGAAHLSDVAALDLAHAPDAQGNYPLPVRRGLLDPDLEIDPAATPRAHRRRLSGRILRQAVTVARGMQALWEKWPTETALNEHLGRLEEFLRAAVGWHRDLPDRLALAEDLRALGDFVSQALELSYDEFVLLAGQTFAELGLPPLGGEGGGVQVLTVMEARDRTFEHLFLMGLNRDIFPRTIREDPLLPDSLRRALLPVLPDIPIKRAAFDEERYLFAQLMSASRSITLSWQTLDDDGRPRPPSPLAERTRLAHEDSIIEVAPTLYAPPQEEGRCDAEAKGRNAYEQAALAGLYGSRGHFGRILPIAIQETRSELDLKAMALETEGLAKARISVLNELDPDRGTPEGRARSHSLGPYHGFIGPVHDEADPRRGDLFITTVENMAACPWQVFIHRLLGIEPSPDPLEALPSLDAALLGSVIHATLERIIRETLSQGPGDLHQARPEHALTVPWPNRGRLEHLLEEEAHRELLDAGLGLAGLTHLLVAQARPYLEVARELDWAESNSMAPVIGAELVGSVVLNDEAGRERSIHFVADRVDLLNERLRLTDYKTGRPISDRGSRETRRRHFLKAVSKGEWLQAVAYVLGARACSPEGRYLFLRPDIPPAAAVFTISAEDGDFFQAFHEVSRTILRSWDRGVFFPRLVEPDGRNEPRRCQHCPVAEACLRGDSGARARLFSWVERQKAAEVEGRTTRPEELALLKAWSLGAEPPPFPLGGTEGLNR